MEKMKIAPVLKKMAVGERVSYPMARYTSVQNTLVRVRREMPERRWSTSTRTGKVEVIREN